MKTHLKTLLISQKTGRVPVSFAYVMGCLRQHQIDYDFIDLEFDCDLESILNDDDYYAVCLSGMSLDFCNLADLIQRIKAVDPQIKIIVGSRIAAMPKDLLKNLKTDFFVHGDADPALPNLLNAIKNNCISPEELAVINGIYFYNKKNLFATKKAKLLNLDTFTPYWNDINLEYYLQKGTTTSLPGAKRLYPLVSGMGCINECQFCAPGVSGFRVRPVDNVIEEMKQAAKKYDIRGYSFITEVFYSTVQQAEEFAEKYTASGINLPYHVNLRMNANPDIVPILAGSGCKVMFAGIESYHNEALASMRKRTTTTNISKMVNEIKKNDISLLSGFMIGNSGDSAESISATTDYFIEKNIATSIHPSALIVYPGTECFEIAKQKDMIGDELEYYKKICINDRSVRFNIESGIGKYYPNITQMSNIELYKQYSIASYKLYKHQLSFSSPKTFNVSELTLTCHKCSSEIILDETRPPISVYLCPSCFASNHFDIHYLTITQDKELIANIEHLFQNHKHIAVVGTYHFMLALCSIAENTGRSLEGVGVYAEGVDQESLNSCLIGVEFISHEEVLQHEAIIYAGLHSPATFLESIDNSSTETKQILNATTKSFKQFHKKQLKNKVTYFEYTNYLDLFELGKSIGEYLSKKDKGVAWVLISDSEYGNNIVDGIKEKELKVVEKFDPGVRGKYLICASRISVEENIKKNLLLDTGCNEDDIIGLSNDLLSIFWDRIFILDE